MARIDPKLREQDPGEPWRWRRDWREGRLHSADGVTAALAWVFATVFGGFSVPLVVKLRSIFQDQGTGPAAFAALFPLAALGMLFWAVRASLRWWRFRGIVFELGTRPGVVGGELRGTLHVPGHGRPDGDLAAQLSCLHRRVRRSGGKRKTEEDVVWQHEVRVPLGSAFSGPTGLALPIAFQVPIECEPSSPEPGVDVHLWRLLVTARLPGIDLASTFEVPVFRTNESSAEVTESRALEAPAGSASSDGPLDTLDDPYASALLLPDGTLELFFPARRNLRGASLLAVFASLWNGGMYWMWTDLGGALALLLLPFAAVGALLALLTIAVAFHSTLVRVQPDGVQIQNRVFGVGGRRFVAADEIAKMLPAVRGGANGRAHWAVRLDRRSGRPAYLGDGLRSKRDAERLAAAVHQILQGERN